MIYEKSHVVDIGGFHSNILKNRLIDQAIFLLNVIEMLTNS